MKIDAAGAIVWFDHPDARDLDLVGGKCRNLAALTAAGLPVPPGFVVSTRAYREFVSSTGLDREIGSLLATADPPTKAPVEAIAQEVARLVSGQPLPAALVEEIGLAYHDLCRRSGRQEGIGVAVRSSATAEDLAEATAAGQQDTFLNGPGAERVVLAVRDCWVSLFSPRALAYRAERSTARPGSLAMAVGVQVLVTARVAGVLFTVNPHTGDDSEVVIEATWGLGEAVVSGLVTPDRYILDKRTRRTTEMSIAQKTVRVVQGAAGTVVERVPPHQQTLPCLTIADREHLVAQACRVEELLGPLQDIEWAIDARGECFLLQARPVTTRPRREPTPRGETPATPRYETLYRSLLRANPGPSAQSGKQNDA